MKRYQPNKKITGIKQEIKATNISIDRESGDEAKRYQKK